MPGTVFQMPRMEPHFHEFHYPSGDDQIHQARCRIPEIFLERLQAPQKHVLLRYPVEESSKMQSNKHRLRGKFRHVYMPFHTRSNLT